MLRDGYFEYLSFKGSIWQTNHHVDLSHDINVCSCYLIFIFMNIIRAQSHRPIILFGWGKHEMALLSNSKMSCILQVQLDLYIHCYNFTETTTLYCAISDHLKYNELNNEAYAGNCLNNVLILYFLSLSTILDSAQFFALSC